MACFVQVLILENRLVSGRVDVRGQRVRFTGRIYRRITEKMARCLVLWSQEQTGQPDF